MSQSKRRSMQEVIANTFIGMVGSFVITLVVLHLVSDRSIAAGVTVAACTVWSLVRGWTIRRSFNKLEKDDEGRYN